MGRSEAAKAAVVISRRSLLALAAAGATYAKGIRYKGVRMGVGTYSFRGLKLAEFTPILKAAGVSGIELEANHLDRDPAEARRLLAASGVEVYGFNAPIGDKLTDSEIEAIVLKAKGLGAQFLNTSTTLTTARRIAPIAVQHKIRVGLHSNGNPANPESIGSGASYLKALEISPVINANIDFYLYRNLGPDPLGFIREHHRRITSVHFHDRKFSAPPAWTPFGEGEAPMKELLLMAKREKFGFVFSLERMYNVANIDHVAEIRRCMDYCRKIVA